MFGTCVVSQFALSGSFVILHIFKSLTRAKQFARSRHKKDEPNSSSFLCRGEDLNLHGSPRLLLRQVRLPISPPRHNYTFCNPQHSTLLYNNLHLHYPYFVLHYRNPPIAQSVEQSPLKRTVVGSNPTGRTRNKKALIRLVLGLLLFLRPVGFEKVARYFVT
jgi:hypothetical protein